MKRYTPHDLARAKRYGDCTRAGVPFDYDLTMSGGIFTLFREPHHTDEQIEAARRELIATRDVVKLDVALPDPKGN